MAEVEEFERLLGAHYEVWRKSLSRGIPRFPTKNHEVLKNQSEELARSLGRMRPFLDHLRPSWLMGHKASGQMWDSLDAAVGLSAVAQIKGPSIRNVKESLLQIIGRLESMEQGEFVELSKQISERVPTAAERDLTTTDRWLKFLKNNRIVAAIIILVVIIISIGQLTDSFGRILSLFNSDSHVEQTFDGDLSVSLRIINTGDIDVTIHPLCEYYLAESNGPMIQQIDKGRLYLKSVDPATLELDLVIEPGDSLWAKVVFRSPEMYQVLLARGSANLHLILRPADGQDFWIQSAPFDKESLSRYYVPFEVGAALEDTLR